MIDRNNVFSLYYSIYSLYTVPVNVNTVPSGNNVNTFININNNNKSEEFVRDSLKKQT